MNLQIVCKFGMNHWDSVAAVSNRLQTAEQIRLIDKGKLAIIRQGRDCTEFWRADLMDRLAKIDTVLDACDGGNLQQRD